MFQDRRKSDLFFRKASEKNMPQLEKKQKKKKYIINPIVKKGNQINA